MVIKIIFAGTNTQNSLRNQIKKCIIRWANMDMDNRNNICGITSGSSQQWDQQTKEVFKC